jgi:DNA-directed RNA polymerase specialized sigma24 family protein
VKSALLFRSNAHPAPGDATDADIQRVFGAEMIDLARLALLLTANGEEAERCLILTIRECFNNRKVCKEQVRTWVRHTLVHVAIRLVLGGDKAVLAHTSNRRASLHFPYSQEYCPMEAPPESAAVLNLPDFERLVLVICVFEGYDVQDCAALLGRTRNDVHAALAWAIDHRVSFQEQETDATSRTSETGTGSFRDATAGDDACGTLLE